MEKSISRRGFIKAAASIGAALAITPALDKVRAAETSIAGAHNGATIKKNGMEYRILGSGDAAMEVSALGFGCMGMNYNRSQSPDKKRVHPYNPRGC